MRRFLFVLAVLGGCSTDTFTGSDAAGDDGGGTSDGGGATDAPFDITSCGPSWCSTQPSTGAGGSCTDFDESTLLPKDWTAETSSSGTVGLVSSPAESCLSLHAHLPAVSANVGGSLARLSRTFVVAGAPTSVHATIALDVRLQPGAAQGLIYFFGIRAGTVTFGLAQHQDGTYFLQPTNNSSAAVQLASQGPTIGSFTHMQLDVTFAANAASAQLAYRRGDGNSDTINANTSIGSLPSAVTFLVGFEAPGVTGASDDGHYDQVVTSLTTQ